VVVTIAQVECYYPPVATYRPKQALEFLEAKWLARQTSIDSAEIY
jgi:hypothetical protein